MTKKMKHSCLCDIRYICYIVLNVFMQLHRVSTTPGNTGILLEFEIPPGNTGNLLEFC